MAFADGAALDANEFDEEEEEEAVCDEEAASPCVDALVSPVSDEMLKLDGLALLANEYCC